MQIKMIMRGNVTRCAINVKSYKEEKELLKITFSNGNIISIKLNDIKKYKVYGDKK